MVVCRGLAGWWLVVILGFRSRFRWVAFGGLSLTFSRRRLRWAFACILFGSPSVGLAKQVYLNRSMMFEDGGRGGGKTNDWLDEPIH